MVQCGIAQKSPLFDVTRKSRLWLAALRAPGHAASRRGPPAAPVPRTDDDEGDIMDATGTVSRPAGTRPERSAHDTSALPVRLATLARYRVGQVLEAVSGVASVIVAALVTNAVGIIVGLVPDVTLSSLMVGSSCAVAALLRLPPGTVEDQVWRVPVAILGFWAGFGAAALTAPLALPNFDWPLAALVPLAFLARRISAFSGTIAFLTVFAFIAGRITGLTPDGLPYTLLASVFGVIVTQFGTWATRSLRGPVRERVTMAAALVLTSWFLDAAERGWSGARSWPEADIDRVLHLFAKIRTVIDRPQDYVTPDRQVRDHITAAAAGLDSAERILVALRERSGPMAPLARARVTTALAIFNAAWHAVDPAGCRRATAYLAETEIPVRAETVPEIRLVAGLRVSLEETLPLLDLWVRREAR